MAEPGGFIEVKRCRKLGAAAQEYRFGAHRPGLLNGILEQPTTDASPTILGSNGHLRQFDNSITHRDEGRTSNGFPICVGHKDSAALAKNGVFRIAERLNIFRLENKITSNQLFV